MKRFTATILALDALAGASVQASDAPHVSDEQYRR
jgi:hypothetical protein